MQMLGCATFIPQFGGSNPDFAEFFKTFLRFFLSLACFRSAASFSFLRKKLIAIGLPSVNPRFFAVLAARSLIPNVC